MFDPKELFVVSAITRKGIADDFNCLLESREVDARLNDDDSRLTVAVCTEYAAALGDIFSEFSEYSPEHDVVQDNCDELQERVLRQIGFGPLLDAADAAASVDD